ncbi:MAG: glycosyltransferase family 39 protein [Patescibacteria group bacterium]
MHLHRIALGALILGTLVVSLFNIGGIPAGISGSEAQHAIRVLAEPESGVYGVLQNVSIHIFGPTPWAARIPSLLFGIGSVAGLYFLARRLFSWEIASLSSILYAGSFWYFLISRTALPEASLAFFATWGFYALWMALATHTHGTFAAAAIIWAAALSTHTLARPMLLAGAIAAAVYFHMTRVHTQDARAQRAHDSLRNGFILFGIVALLLVSYFGAQNILPASAGTALVADWSAGVRTALARLFMPSITQWQNGIVGSSLVFWPVAALALTGLLRNIIKILKELNGSSHVSPTHTLLVAWFFCGLVGGALIDDLRVTIRLASIAPVVFLFAGQALWWFMDRLADWYHAKHPHDLSVRLPHGSMHVQEGALTAVMVALTFVLAMGVAETVRAHVIWGTNPDVRELYRADDVSMLKRIREHGGPVIIIARTTAQSAPIRFLTQTFTEEQQQIKNILYLSPEQYSRVRISDGTLVLVLP